jgi:hypothetical protein
MTEPNGKNNEADHGTDGPQTTLVPAQVQEVIKDLPAPKRQEIVHSIQETITAAIRIGQTPPVDPETAKILASTIEKDNDNKFRYLTQKQADSAKEREREQSLEAAHHTDIVRPVVWAVIAVTLIAVGSGVYFISIGKEAIGSSLLTGIFGAILGFLGGLGTARSKN